MVMLQQKCQCLGWPESSATGCDMAVQAMPHGGIAYYNCGPQSGASQAHKHLQVLRAGAPRMHGHYQRWLWLWDLASKELSLLQVVPLPLMEGLPPRLPFGDILAAATADAGGGMAAVEQLPYRCFAARLEPDR